MITICSVWSHLGISILVKELLGCNRGLYESMDGVGLQEGAAQNNPSVVYSVNIGTFITWCDLLYTLTSKLLIPKM